MVYAARRAPICEKGAESSDARRAPIREKGAESNCLCHQTGSNQREKGEPRDLEVPKFKDEI